MAETSVAEDVPTDDIDGRRSVSWEQDLFIAFALFLGLLAVFISIEFVELVYEFSRDYEHWQLDEILASIPALALALCWYAVRRWIEARRLNETLASANEALRSKIAQRQAAEAG